MSFEYWYTKEKFDPVIHPKDLMKGAWDAGHKEGYADAYGDLQEVFGLENES